MKISAIICAAGKGERTGFNKNKLLYPFHGANALCYTVDRVKAFSFYLKNHGVDELTEIIVTSSHADFDEICALCAPMGCKVVLGGERRTNSVYNALKEVSGDFVIIHDGARPYTAIEQFAECLQCAKEYQSAICAMPVTDTIAAVKDGWIGNIPRRNELYAVQTPQIFATKSIKCAYEKAMQSGESFTDDGSVYSRYISPARICGCGSADNKKLTFKSDFVNAQIEAQLTQKLNSERGRAGFGVDVHAFGKPADFVTLCGVKIPCDCALVAHSDGDVVLHAVMDALLSAAGLKDIGHYFPDSDPAYKDADSALLLKRVVELIAQKGLKTYSLAIAIQAEKPRLARYIDDMGVNLAYLTGADKDKISITAGTCEGLGFVGEGRGICAYCAAIVQNISG